MQVHESSKRQSAEDQINIQKIGRMPINGYRHNGDFIYTVIVALTVVTVRLTAGCWTCNFIPPGVDNLSIRCHTAQQKQGYQKGGVWLAEQVRRGVSNEPLRQRLVDELLVHFCYAVRSTILSVCIQTVASWQERLDTKFDPLRSDCPHKAVGFFRTSFQWVQ